MQVDQQEIECPHCKGQIKFIVKFSAGRTNFKIPAGEEDEKFRYTGSFYLTPAVVHKEEEIEL